MGFQFYADAIGESTVFIQLFPSADQEVDGVAVDNIGNTVSTSVFVNIDTNAPSTANGGVGTRTILNESIDPTQLPYRLVGGTCVPVMPNDFLRANSIFSVAHHVLPPRHVLPAVVFFTLCVLSL